MSDMRQQFTCQDARLRTAVSHGMKALHGLHSSSAIARPWASLVAKRSLSELGMLPRPASVMSADSDPTSSSLSPVPGSNETAGDEAPSTPSAEQKVQAALKAGELGFGFSAGGFLYSYHLGVLWELERLGLLRGRVLMAGASAGSLAIATFNSGIQEREATQALKDFAAECRSGGTQGRLSGLLREFLGSYFPDDAHERCSDTCYVAVTRLLPYVQPEVVSHFDTKQDLIDALLTSCHIPVYVNGSWATKFRGRYYVDGGVTDFVPSPPTPTVIKVCCFPVNRIFSRIKPSLGGFSRLTSAIDISVSPDAFEPFPYSYRTLLKWALLPAPDDVIDWLVYKGKRDAAAWAASMHLVEKVAT